MTKVLMVCLGNICRSPLAEGILKSMVNQDKVFVDSAGTGGYHIGAPPDKRSIAVAKANRIDISQQRARKFVASDFDNFDLIYVMDRSNLKNVTNLCNKASQLKKVSLLLEDMHSDITEVPDPYYGGNDGFKNVFEMIYQACGKIAAKLS